MTKNQIEKIVESAENENAGLAEIGAKAADYLIKAGLPEEWFKSKNGAKAFADVACWFAEFGSQSCFKNIKRAFVEKAKKLKEGK